MKRIYLLLLLSFSTNLLAQQALTKRNRLGFTIAQGFSYNTSNSNILLIQDNFAPSFSLGGIYEYQYTDLLAFRGSMNFEFMKASVSDNTQDSIDLYYYTTRPHAFNESPCDYDNLIDVYNVYSQTPPRFRQLNQRKYEFLYLTVPIDVVFRSKMIKYNRFYLKTGLKCNIALRHKGQDNYSNVNDQENKDYEDQVLLRDVNYFKWSLTGGFGFEHVFTGASTFFIDIECDLAINNTFSQKQDDATIFVNQGLTEYYDINKITGSQEFAKNSLRQNLVRIKFGFLF